MKQQTLNLSHTASQRERLKSHLDKGRSINRLQSFNILGCFELSARIVELQQTGYQVSKKWTKIKNRFGEDVRVMEYRKDV